MEQMVPVVTGLMVVGFDALHKLADGAIAGPILFFFLCLYLIVLAFSERLRRKSYHTLLYICSCGTWAPTEAVQSQPPPQGPSKEQAVEPTPQAPSGAGSAGFIPPPAPLLELSQSRFARAQARKAMEEEETTNTPTPQQPSGGQREAKGSPSSSRRPAPRLKISLVDATDGDNATRS